MGGNEIQHWLLRNCTYPSYFVSCGVELETVTLPVICNSLFKSIVCKAVIIVVVVVCYLATTTNKTIICGKISKKRANHPSVSLVASLQTTTLLIHICALIFLKKLPPILCCLTNLRLGSVGERARDGQRAAPVEATATYFRVRQPTDDGL